MWEDYHEASAEYQKLKKFLAMAGICLISFNGSSLKLNPLGDLLALSATVVWGCYSVLTRKISSYGYGTVQTTRKIFGYGLLFILSAMIFLI